MLALRTVRDDLDRNQLGRQTNGLWQKALCLSAYFLRLDLVSLSKLVNFRKLFQVLLLLPQWLLFNVKVVNLVALIYVNRASFSEEKWLFWCKHAFTFERRHCLRCLSELKCLLHVRRAKLTRSATHSDAGLSYVWLGWYRAILTIVPNGPELIRIRRKSYDFAT